MRSLKKQMNLTDKRKYYINLIQEELENKIVLK